MTAPEDRVYLWDGAAVTKAEYDRLRKRRRRAARAGRTDAQIAAERDALHPEGTKECRVCRRPRQFGQFKANRCAPDGLGDVCWPCIERRIVAREQEERLARRVARAAMEAMDD